VFYVIVFAAIAVLLVVVVLVSRGRRTGTVDPAPHHHPGTEGASHTPAGSKERRERKRRRAQSRHDRRKRH
jgi:hypothetical protein